MGFKRDFLCVLESIENLSNDIEEGVISDYMATSRISEIGDSLYDLSCDRVSKFYERRNAIHCKIDVSDRGFLMCRTYKNKVNGIETGGVSEWFVQKINYRNLDKKGSTNVYSMRIPKGRGVKYISEKVLTKERKEYEAKLFNKFEPQFAEVRLCSEKLRKLRRKLNDKRRSEKIKKTVVKDKKSFLTGAKLWASVCGVKTLFK